MAVAASCLLGCTATVALAWSLAALRRIVRPGLVLRRGAGAAPSAAAFSAWLSRRRQRSYQTSLALDLDREALSWLDLVLLGSEAGMTLPQIVDHSEGRTGPAFARVIRLARERLGAGLTTVTGLENALFEHGGPLCRQIGRLLVEGSRQGLSLEQSVRYLREDALRRRRQRMEGRINTMGLRLTLGTIFLLFPPVFVLTVLPNILTFISSRW